MRLNLRFVPCSLEQALTRIGYCHVGTKGSAGEWRRREYHLTVRPHHKRGLVLQLHEDVPYSLPPFHRAKHEGKNLEAEIDKILEAYRRIRQIGH